MSAGFRKSFLGFNCDDVIKYIESAQSRFSKREGELQTEIDSLNERNNDTLKQMNELCTEKAAIEAELAQYRAKCDEIEQLSESIGKLYLVSQTSAKNIISNSVASSRLANEEIFKNIDCIDTAHTSLEDIKSEIEDTAKNFVNKVSELCSSLESTKAELIDRGADSERQLEEFHAVFNKINNAE